MCKEMPFIPVDKVVVKKRIIGKMGGLGGGVAQRVADNPIPPKKDSSAGGSNANTFVNMYYALCIMELGLGTRVTRLDKFSPNDRPIAYFG
jgi:hypothetical protein